MKINSYSIIHALRGKFAGLTFQIREKEGNIVFKRKYFPGLPNLAIEAMIARYNSLTGDELTKWEEVAIMEKFNSRYQAFASSFLLYVTQYGLGNAIVDPIPYTFSRVRIQRIQRQSILVDKLMREADIKSDPNTGFGTKGFGVGGFGTKRKDDINASLKTLKTYGKELKYFCILPKMRTEQDVSEASLLGLLKPNTGFGTKGFGTGRYGSTRQNADPSGYGAKPYGTGRFSSKRV